MALYIGLMSGTSVDGIDAVLLDVTTNRCVLGITCPYGDEARRFLEDILNPQASIQLHTLSQLSTLLGREFGQAVLTLLDKAHCQAKDVIAIGSHGQTICHDVNANIPYTVQLACPHTIAEMTGIRVVADFRTRDLVVGGQGAPFAPLYHQVLFGHQQLPLAVVNIGGIANVTFLETLQPPCGYDTGPGNCLMDAWVCKHLSQPYDVDGAWAASGKVIESLLNALLSDPYFQSKPPKSIGKEVFSLSWLTAHLHEGFAPEDVQSTLLELTVQTISQAIHDYPSQLGTVVLCGGGVHNLTLQRALQDHLPEAVVVSSVTFGVDPDYIEAMMFAWLAEKTISQTPIDLSALTGAKKSVILGGIYSVC